MGADPGHLHADDAGLRLRGGGAGLPRVGVNAPTPTLGNILNESISYADVVPTFFFIPGFTIAAIVVSFNLLGDGIRDALDPKGHQ